MHKNTLSLTESNKSTVNEFMEFRYGSIDSLTRTAKAYRSMLLQFASEVSKPIPECDELDVQKFMERHCKKDASWNAYLSTLRRFYAWYFNRDKHTPQKKWKPPEFFNLLEWKSARSWKYGPNDMWSEEDILMAISSLDHPRDKALIAMLYDLAARPVELLALRIKDIALKENFAQVKLLDHSNPEGRIIPVTFAFHYLLTWLNNHPLKDSPDAPLWVRLEGTPKRISYSALYQLCVKTLKKKLSHKVHKPFNPYCIGDHSRLTNLVESGVSEFELKRFRGWALDSKMARRYVHMSGKGLNEKLLELAGIKKRDAIEKESPLKAKECYRCKQKNAPDAKYCIKCNFVLTAEAFEELKGKEEERNKELEEIKTELSKIKHDNDLTARLLYLNEKIKAAVESGELIELLRDRVFQEAVESLYPECVKIYRSSFRPVLQNGKPLDISDEKLNRPDLDTLLTVIDCATSFKTAKLIDFNKLLREGSNEKEGRTVLPF